MEWGFDQFTAVSLLKSGQPIPVQVQVHEGPLIQPVAANDLKLVVRKADAAVGKGRVRCSRRRSTDRSRPENRWGE